MQVHDILLQQMSLNSHKNEMQIERIAAEREGAAAAEIEELRRQLEGAGQELDEWRVQVADASEQAQHSQSQLHERTQQLTAVQVCTPVQ